MADKYIFLKVADNGTPFAKPSDFNDSANTIIALAGGAGGAAFTSSGGGQPGAGGSSGGIHIATNVTLSASNQFTVGSGGVGGTASTTATGANGGAGGDTFFGGASLGAALVGAQGGQVNASNSYQAGAGGASYGTLAGTKTPGSAGGGAGGVGWNGCGGGAGAPGPNGSGGAGGSPAAASASGGGGGGGANGGAAGTGAASGSAVGGVGGNNRSAAGAGSGGAANTAGGAGTNGGGGGGGGATSGIGGAGSQDGIWTATDGTYAGQTAGPGSGGGAGASAPGGAAGGFGAGGGGSVQTTGQPGGAGSNGLIVIIYTPATASGSAQNMGGTAVGCGVGLCFPFGSGAGASASAPANTLAPTISTAVIGTPMAIASYGTWTNSPTSYAVNWKVNGVSKGASYTPVEADRTQNIIAEVTATNAGGSSPPATSAASVVRRTEPTVAYNYGKLTPAGWGYVSIANLLAAAGRPMIGAGVTPPSAGNWTIAAATAGTDGHWTRTADNTPKISAAGVTAALSSASYVFTMTATFPDAVVETQQLTITPKANVATLGPNDPGFSYKTTLQSAIDVAGGAVEIAVGWPGSTPMPIDSFRPTNTIIWRFADLARAVPLVYFYLTGCANMQLESLRTDNTYSAASAGTRMYLTGNGSGQDCDGLVINDFQHLGNDATNVYLFGVGFGVIRLAGVQNTTINNAYLRCVGCGVKQDGARALNVVFNGLVVDTFYDNALFIGGDSSTFGSNCNGITLKDTLLMRPTRIPGDTQHCDFLQIPDVADQGYVKIIRMIMAEAGGNANGQFHFGGADGIIDLSGRGVIGVGRTNWGYHQQTGNNTLFDYFAFWKANGSTTGSPGAGVDDSPIDGPNIRVSNETGITGTATLDKGLVYGTVSNVGGAWTITSSVRAFGGTNATDPAAAAALFATGSPRVKLEAISNATWLAMTPAQVIATVKAAMRPANGSVIDGESPISAATGDWHPTVLAA